MSHEVNRRVRVGEKSVNLFSSIFLKASDLDIVGIKCFENAALYLAGETCRKRSRQRSWEDNSKFFFRHTFSTTTVHLLNKRILLLYSWQQRPESFQEKNPAAHVGIFWSLRIMDTTKVLLHRLLHWKPGSAQIKIRFKKFRFLSDFFWNC